MTFNAQLARDTLAFIKQLPSAEEVEVAPSGAFDEDTLVWAQGDWFATIYSDVTEEPCGTGMCFAGWVAYNAGYVKMTNGSCRKTDNASWTAISEVANTLLGLPDHETSHDLFRGSNTLADIEAEIDRIELREQQRLREAADAYGH